MPVVEMAIDPPSAVAAVLDRSALKEWIFLSDATYRAGQQPPVSHYDALARVRKKYAGSWLGIVSTFWTAELKSRNGSHDDAVDLYDTVISTADQTDKVADVDLVSSSCHHLATVLARQGATRSAVKLLSTVSRRDNNYQGLFEAGQLFEEAGAYSDAAEKYEAIAATELSAHAGDVRQVAARHLRRLETPEDQFASSAEELGESIWKSLSARNASQLVNLASETHFSAAPGAGHSSFDVKTDTPDLLASELSKGLSRRSETMAGSGGRGSPWVNASNRLEARVAAPGLVADACFENPMGSPAGANVVNILHDDPATGDI